MMNGSSSDGMMVMTYNIYCWLIGSDVDTKYIIHIYIIHIYTYWVLLIKTVKKLRRKYEVQHLAAVVRAAAVLFFVAGSFSIFYFLTF